MIRSALGLVLTEAKIVAVDLLPTMVVEAERRLVEAGFGEHAGAVVAGAETEMEMFRRFSDCYSYEFFIAQPAG